MIIAVVCFTQLHEYAIASARVAKPFEGPKTDIQHINAQRKATGAIPLPEFYKSPKIRSSSSTKDQIDLNLQAQDQNIQSSDSTMPTQSLSLDLPGQIKTQTNPKLSQASAKPQPVKKIISANTLLQH